MSEHEFTGWRKYLWPIHDIELKKFLPMALIFFCILFNYTLLRDIKDPLLNTAAGGAGLIPTAKILTMVAAVLFVISYAKLSNIFDSEKIFYVITTPFLIFFGLFGFVLHPLEYYLHATPETIKVWTDAYPVFANLITACGYWTFTLFYVVAEIWGSVMIGLMFWQFANRITRVTEAKRFYGFFGSLANTSLIFAGLAAAFMTDGINALRPNMHHENWVLSMQLCAAVIVVSGILCMYLYRWMHKAVLTDPVYYDATEEKAEKKKKHKPGLIESMKIIATSPVLGFITLLLLWYGVTINLIELQWKNQLTQYYINMYGSKAAAKGPIGAFMGYHSVAIGAVTILFSGLIGANILRRFSWLTAALITPLMILTLGALFFASILGYNPLGISLLFGTPIATAVFVGVAAVVISKSIKYALFDPTKEMAYMPLETDLKTKGKAACDVIGGRLGKSGGASLQEFLLVALLAKGDVLIIAPYTGLVFLIGCTLWVVAVFGLNRRVKESIRKKEEIEAQHLAEAEKSEKA